MNSKNSRRDSVTPFSYYGSDDDPSGSSSNNSSCSDSSRDVPTEEKNEVDIRSIILRFNAYLQARGQPGATTVSQDRRRFFSGRSRPKYRSKSRLEWENDRQMLLKRSASMPDVGRSDGDSNQALFFGELPVAVHNAGKRKTIKSDIPATVNGDQSDSAQLIDQRTPLINSQDTPDVSKQDNLDVSNQHIPAVNPQDNPEVSSQNKSAVSSRDTPDINNQYRSTPDNNNQDTADVKSQHTSDANDQEALHVNDLDADTADVKECSDLKGNPSLTRSDDGGSGATAASSIQDNSAEQRPYHADVSSLSSEEDKEPAPCGKLRTPPRKGSPPHGARRGICSHPSVRGRRRDGFGHRARGIARVYGHGFGRRDFFPRPGANGFFPGYRPAGSGRGRAVFAFGPSLRGANRPRGYVSHQGRGSWARNLCGRPTAFGWCTGRGRGGYSAFRGRGTARSRFSLHASGFFRGEGCRAICSGRGRTCDWDKPRVGGERTRERDWETERHEVRCPDTQDVSFQSGRARHRQALDRSAVPRHRSAPPTHQLTDRCPRHRSLSRDPRPAHGLPEGQRPAGWSQNTGRCGSTLLAKPQASRGSCACASGGPAAGPHESQRRDGPQTSLWRDGSQAPLQRHAPDSLQRRDEPGSAQRRDGSRGCQWRGGPDSPQRRDGSHTPQWRDGPDSPQWLDGPHTPQWRDGSHTPQWRDGSHSPQWRDGPDSPQRRDGSHTPQWRDGSHKPQWHDGPKSAQLPCDGLHLLRHGCHGPHSFQGRDGPQAPQWHGHQSANMLTGLMDRHDRLSPVVKQLERVPCANHQNAFHGNHQENQHEVNARQREKRHEFHARQQENRHEFHARHQEKKHEVHAGHQEKHVFFACEWGNDHEMHTNLRECGHGFHENQKGNLRQFHACRPKHEHDMNRSQQGCRDQCHADQRANLRNLNASYHRNRNEVSAHKQGNERELHANQFHFQQHRNEHGLSTNDEGHQHKFRVKLEARHHENHGDHRECQLECRTNQQENTQVHGKRQETSRKFHCNQRRSGNHSNRHDTRREFHGNARNWQQTSTNWTRNRPHYVHYVDNHHQFDADLHVMPGTFHDNQQEDWCHYVHRPAVWHDVNAGQQTDNQMPAIHKQSNHPSGNGIPLQSPGHHIHQNRRRCSEDIQLSPSVSLRYRYLFYLSDQARSDPRAGFDENQQQYGLDNQQRQGKQVDKERTRIAERQGLFLSAVDERGIDDHQCEAEDVNGNTTMPFQPTSNEKNAQVATATGQPPRTGLNGQQNSQLLSPTREPFVPAEFRAGPVDAPFFQPVDNNPFPQVAHAPLVQPNVFQFPPPSQVVSFEFQGHMSTTPGVFQAAMMSAGPVPPGQPPPLGTDQTGQRRPRASSDAPSGFAGNRPMVKLPPVRGSNMLLPPPAGFRLDNVSQPVTAHDNWAAAAAAAAEAHGMDINGNA